MCLTLLLPLNMGCEPPSCDAAAARHAGGYQKVSSLLFSVLGKRCHDVRWSQSTIE